MVSAKQSRKKNTKPWRGFAEIVRLIYPSFPAAWLTCHRLVLIVGCLFYVVIRPIDSHNYFSVFSRRFYGYCQLKKRRSDEHLIIGPQPIGLRHRSTTTPKDQSGCVHVLRHFLRVFLNTCARIKTLSTRKRTLATLRKLVRATLGSWSFFLARRWYFLLRLSSEQLGPV